MGGAFDPTPAGATLRPSAYVAAHAEVGFFSAPDADVSPYSAVLFGIEHHRFRGSAPLAGADAEGSAFATGLSFGLRLGVELMRTTTVRFDAFAQGTLPAFVTRDLDGGVLDAWIPSMAAGAGIAF
jgi:hypothetical protein